MRLSIMRDFLTADSTEVLLSLVLRQWRYEEGSLRFFRASSNFVFTFYSNKQQYVLRLTDSYDRTYAEVEAELDFLKLLAEQGLPVNKPIASQSGDEIATFESPVGILFAVVFPFIAGQIHEIDELTEDDFYRWGKSLGTLHKHSQNVPPHNSIVKNLPSYEKHLQFIQNRIASESEDVLQEFNAVQFWFNELPQQEMQSGIIHFDFELDNLIWTENGITAIDFEQCSYYGYAADLAFALRDLFTEDCDLNGLPFRLFLKGYREELSIPDADIELIPGFLRFHRLFIFATLLKTLDVNTDNQQDPEWIVNLVNRLMKKADDYRRQLSQP